MNEQPKAANFREGFVEDQPEGFVEAPAPAPVEEKEVWPITVKLLHKSIRDQRGNTLSEIVFREPTGGDINRYGNPVRIDQNGDVIIDERKMSMIMSSLAGLLMPMIERMDPRDWNSCAYRLRGFFLPDLSSW